MPHRMGEFPIKGRLLSYIDFVPKLYGLCRSYGFEEGKIMPSRAFCSDESQGLPIILITKQFGTFPFSHGRVGGIVATGRHPAHAHHGKDLVIIQASHVGYDPENKHFGTYRRLQMEGRQMSSACGKIYMVLDWYLKEYAFARANIHCTRIDEEPMLIIDNQLLDVEREAGLMLHLEKMIDLKPGGVIEPARVFSTSKAFRIKGDFKDSLPDSLWRSDRREPIDGHLASDLFKFSNAISSMPEWQHQLELNLSHNMPRIVTSPHPGLVAAQTNTQLEFDRAYRSILLEPEYQGKNLVFVAGINIDISPQGSQRFPFTEFVPWAAYVQTQDGRQLLLEQEELFAALQSQDAGVDSQLDLEVAIRESMAGPGYEIDLDA